MWSRRAALREHRRRVAGPPHAAAMMPFCGAVSSFSFLDATTKSSWITLHGVLYGPKRAQLLISTGRVDAAVDSAAVVAFWGFGLIEFDQAVS